MQTSCVALFATSAMPSSNADWVSALGRQLTSSLLDQRVGRIRREYPLGGDADGVLVLKPQEPEIVDALQEIRLDEDVTRNHAAGDERSVGAIDRKSTRLNSSHLGTSYA